MMNFEFKVVDVDKAENLRRGFISNFVDITHGKFKEHIETFHTYPDGEFYVGYLWDFLLDNRNYEYECNMETACEYLKQQKNVYVMWDLFSNHRVVDKSKFATEYDKNTVIEAAAAMVSQLIPNEWQNWDNNFQGWFPSDIYCFDDTMSWYVIFTHEGWDNYSNPELEEDEYIRICFVKRKEQQ